VIKKIIIGLILICIVFSFFACSQQQLHIQENRFDINSFRDIPDITKEEIEAIETLKKSRSQFIYGSMLTTEAFMLSDGTKAGFKTFFSELLSELFGIPFVQEIIPWDMLKEGLDTKTIDFTGELTPTPERELEYFMTYPIAERVLCVYTLDHISKIELIDLNGCKIGFYKGTITAESILSAYSELNFEIVDIYDYQDLIDKITTGEIEMFIDDAVSMFALSGILTPHENIFPLIYTPVSMTTANPELAPVISVVNKYIKSGGIDKIYDLYIKGYLEYAKFDFYKSLTDTEKEYLDNLLKTNTKIPISLETQNYPISFYNKNDKSYQGIAPEVLREITVLSGIEFENISGPDDSWDIIFQRLISGETTMVSELLKTENRIGSFLWSEIPFATTRYALISKVDFPFLEPYQVIRANVGVLKSSALEDVFISMFPQHDKIIYFDNNDVSFDALENGEVDLLMSTENLFLMLLHYLEKPGYKINISFNSPVVESFFGFNINEDILISIIDKALIKINTDKIEKNWVNRSFNYERIMADQRAYFANRTLTLMFIFSVILLFLLIVLVILFNKNKKQINLIKYREELLSTTLNKMNEVTKQKNNTLISLEKILNSIDTGIYVTVPETGELLFVNTFLKETLNIEDDIIGKYCYKIFRTGLNEICDFCPCLQLDKDPDKTIVWEEYEPETGKTLQRSDCYINWYDGRRVHLQHVIDITELVTAKNLAEQGNRVKSLFLAQMSHEIRTPINAILGISEIFIQDKNTLNEIFTGGAKEGFRKIYESGSLLTNIINDILDFSKIEAGKLEIIPKKYNVPIFINDSVQLNRIRYEDKPIEFILLMDENMPVEAIGDELRIRQILNNLLSNAFKYTEKGKVELSISFEPGDSETIIFVFKVSDTGQGMNKDQLSRLFNEYERFNMQTNQGINGTGLGLNITNRLVELMNGEIITDSIVGEGSVFIIRIPQKKCTSIVCGKDVTLSLQNFSFRSTSLQNNEEIIHEYMPDNKVLIVDDVETNLFVAKGLILPYGLQIETALNGFEAVEKIKNGNFYDIIFMDHMMPKMNGIDAVKIIRDMGYIHPIVALTANAIHGQEEVFLSNGFNDFISKPINSRELDLTLKHFIKSKNILSAKQKSDTNEKSHNISAGNKLTEIEKYFVLDAENTLNVLNELKPKLQGVNPNLTDEELELYTITIHGMKTALANIGENKLSDDALKLEQAGDNRDYAVLVNETPEFIDALQSLLNIIKYREKS